MSTMQLTGRQNYKALPDPAARETDRMIEEITKRLRKEYEQAAKETKSKLDDYLRRFEIKDKKWQEWVLSGEKTEAEYKAWRESQIMVGKRWEELKNQLAQEMHRRNITAREYVNGQMPKAYAENHNYAMYEVESGAHVDLSYTLYDENTVKRILVEQPELLPPPGKMMQRKLKLDPDIRWQKGQLQSLTLQSILQGESIPNMAKRISRTLGERNMKSAVRYARTAMTGAQNAGREDGYKRAVKLGIDMEEEWMAIHDGRTRHEHRLMDDQRKKVGDVFVVPGTTDTIRFPGDPTAPGYLIWNCRCTTRAVVAGWQSMSKQGQVIKTGQTYAEWKADHGVSQDILTQKKKGEAIRDKYIEEYRTSKAPPYAGKRITNEFINNARPNKGQIIIPEGYDRELYEAEVKFAEWVKENLGGSIELLKPKDVKMADYLWNGKLWDLKGPSTPKAANAAVRSGLHQIKDNPGGIFLNYGDIGIDIKELKKIVDERMRRKAKDSIDVVVVSKGKVLEVWRYNNETTPRR